MYLEIYSMVIYSKNFKTRIVYLHNLKNVQMDT